MNSKTVQKMLTKFGEVKGGLAERIGQMESKVYRKGTILLSEGKVCTTGFHIVKGMLRVFYIYNGKEVTSRFAEAGEACISYESFYSQKPSHEYIDVIDDAVITLIPYTAMQEMYDEFPEFNRIVRVGMENSHIRSESRARIIRSLPAQERYQEMKSAYPAVFDKATTEQIASFLGLQRETLSRIIKKERQTPEDKDEENEQWRRAIEIGGFPV